MEHAGHHVVDAAKHNHGEKSVYPVMGVPHGEVGKVCDEVDVSQGHGGANQTDEGVINGTENDKTDGGTAPAFFMQTDHREVVIDSDDNDGDDHHNGGDDASGDQPNGDGATDEMVDAGPVVEECEGPKSKDGEVVGIDRPAQYFGNEIVGGAQGHGCVPEAECVVTKPPVDNGLHNSLCGRPEDHENRDNVKPREPEEAGKEVPLRDVDVIAPSEAECDNAPDADEDIGNGQKRRSVGRDLEPFNGGEVSTEDSKDAEGDAQVPEDTGDDE